MARCSSAARRLSVAARNRLPSELVEHLRDHLDQRPENRVGRRGRNRLVESNVVLEERLGRVERREHLRRLVADRHQPLGRHALSGQARDRDLEHETRLEHLGTREPVQRGKETERLTGQHRRPGCNERARTLSDLNDPHRGQALQAGPHARPAHPELARQVAFRWQPVAGLHRPLVDQGPDAGDDNFSSGHLPRRCPVHRGITTHGSSVGSRA